MSMSRAALMVELWANQQENFTELGITNADTSGNLKEILDRTFRALGVATDDLTTTPIDESNVIDAINLAEYFALVRMSRMVARRVDGSKSASAPSVSRTDNWSQFVKNLKDDRDELRGTIASYLPADGSWGAGYISIPYVASSSDLDEYAEDWAS